jgi:hypothetical protein
MERMMNRITHRILFSFIIAISLGNIGCGGSAGAKVQQKKAPDGKTETTIEGVFPASVRERIG